MRCTTPARKCAILFATLLPILGCQAYQARPLDLQRYAQDWAARSLEDPILTRTNPAFDPSDGLTLDEAEVVAMVFNADLHAQRLRAKVPQAGAEFAGLWDDPELDVGLLRFVNSMDDPWISGVGLSFTLPLSGRLRVEEDQAWAQAEHAWLSAAQSEWLVLAELRAAWVTWAALRQRITALDTYLAELGSLAETIDRLVEAGEIEPASARLLAIDAAGRRLERARLASQARLVRLDLHALLGLHPDAPVTLHPEMPAWAPAADREPQDAIRGHPDMRLALSAYASAELALEREVVKQRPDLTIGPRFEDEEGQSRIGVGFGIPLPLWNRNRRGIAEATAARDASAAEARATLQRLTHELAAAEASYTAADAHAEQTRLTLQPLAQEQVRALRRLAELGEVDVLLLREALASVAEARLAVIDAVEARAAAAAVLDSISNLRWALPDPGRGTGWEPLSPDTPHTGSETDR